MKNIVNTFYSNFYTCKVTNIPNVKFYFLVINAFTKIILFFFVSTKNSDFFEMVCM